MEKWVKIGTYASLIIEAYGNKRRLVESNGNIIHVYNINQIFGKDNMTNVKEFDVIEKDGINAVISVVKEQYRRKGRVKVVINNEKHKKTGGKGEKK